MFGMFGMLLLSRHGCACVGRAAVAFHWPGLYCVMLVWLCGVSVRGKIALQWLHYGCFSTPAIFWTSAAVRILCLS
jgi:hypothetical protein